MTKIALTLALALPLVAAGPLKTVAVTTQDSVPFSGGTIRVAATYGQVNVEPWDEQRVQVTVTRSTFRHGTPKAQEAGKQYLERIKVSVKQASDGTVEITTAFPGRNWFLRTFHGLGDFTLNYRIQAPANAKLVVRNHVGDVVVTGMTGDVTASVHAGDIVVQVPQPEKCAVDARVDLGDVFGDVPGEVHGVHLIGQRFAPNAASAEQHLHLRVGVGGISVQGTE